MPCGRADQTPLKQMRIIKSCLRGVFCKSSSAPESLTKVSQESFDAALYLTSAFLQRQNVM